MEDFGDEDFKQILQEGEAYIAAQRVAQEPTSKSKEDSTGYEKQVVYLRLPTNVCLHIIKNHKIDCPNRHIPIDNPEFKYGTLSLLPANLNIPEEMKGLSLPWIVKRVVGGWYKGHTANTALLVNRLAAFENQVEFVPVDVAGHKYAVLMKCRYGSVPYIPGASWCPWANNIFRLDDKGIFPREVPVQLVDAFKLSKCQWTNIVAAGLINRVKAVVPKVPNANAMAWVLGAANRARITDLAKQIVPNAAYKIADARDGIFSGNSAAWSAWFNGFAYDEFGAVSVARMLVGLGYTRVFGQLNDMPTWATTPCVLKVPTQVESIVKHTFIDYRDTSKWPENYLVYIATPMELLLCVRTSSVKALAMPVTAVLACAPQVHTFAIRHEKVAVRIAMSEPPVAIFESSDEGFLGLGLKDQLKLLEKAIIAGFLQVFLERVKGNQVFGFDIKPAATYSATACHVKIEIFNDKPAFASQRYVSQNDAEKKKILPTDRVSDVRVDGELIFEQANQAVIPIYPRTSPHYYVQDNNAFLKLKDSFLYQTNRPLQDQVILDPNFWHAGKGIEVVGGVADEVFIKAGGLDPEEKKDEPEEVPVNNPDPAQQPAPDMPEGGGEDMDVEPPGVPNPLGEAAARAEAAR